MSFDRRRLSVSADGLTIDELRGVIGDGECGEWDFITVKCGGVGMAVAAAGMWCRPVFVVWKWPVPPNCVGGHRF